MRLRKAIPLLAALVGLVLVLALYCHTWKSRSRTVQSSLPALLPKDEAAALYSQIKARGHHFMTDDKLQVSMPFSDYPEDVPLIIIAPRIRTLEGTMIEASPYKMEFTGNDGKPSSGSWDLTGRELCLAIPQEKMECSLAAGRKYLVYSYFRATGNDSPGTKHTAELTTPENVANGQVYRVELVVKDEILEQKLLAEQKAEAERLKQIVKEETITLNIQEYPGDSPEKSVWVALYDDGSRGRETVVKDMRRVIEIKGPNKLGGELSLVRYPEKGTRMVWVVVENLKKRAVNLPEDADLVINTTARFIIIPC